MGGGCSAFISDSQLPLDEGRDHQEGLKRKRPSVIYDIDATSVSGSGKIYKDEEDKLFYIPDRSSEGVQTPGYSVTPGPGNTSPYFYFVR